MVEKKDLNPIKYRLEYSFPWDKPVSYTHLDVYKRQEGNTKVF